MRAKKFSENFKRAGKKFLAGSRKVFGGVKHVAGEVGGAVLNGAKEVGKEVGSGAKQVGKEVAHEAGKELVRNGARIAVESLMGA